MRLETLLQGADFERVCGTLDKEAKTLIYHSDKSSLGAVFFAIKGEKADGRDFIKEAAEKGVKTFVVEDCQGDFPKNATVIRTGDARKALAIASKNFFRRPDEELRVVGITGTKGKTGTSFMLKAILESSGIKTGIIGTVMQGFEGHYIEAENTTPQSFEIYRMLREMTDSGCKAAVMEVSSQALKQHRTFGIDFDIGIFTNLSPDHIGTGEHKDFEEYRECKSRLFRQSRLAVLNEDSEYAAYMAENLQENLCEKFTGNFWTESVEKAESAKNTAITERKVFFGMKQAEDIRIFRDGYLLGTEFVFHGEKIRLPLPGRFNIYNAMAAMSAAKALGIEYGEMPRALENIKIRGRAEILPTHSDYTVVLDYAHNGVALESLLKALREYEPKRLIAVFGCGGERDHKRRSEMGLCAGKYADLTVITSDNPRGEPPEKIIREIAEAVSETEGKFVIIEDRKQALAWVIEQAQKGDIIAVCGKGHETYQIIGDNRIHFDDKEVIGEIIGRQNERVYHCRSGIGSKRKID